MSAFDFVGRRRLKHLIAPCLPERWKAPFRARLYGYREAEVRLPADFSADAEGPFVTIDRRVRLRLREEDRPDLEYHLLDNGASMEEMSSFLSRLRRDHLLRRRRRERDLFAGILPVRIRQGRGGIRAVAYDVRVGTRVVGTEWTGVADRPEAVCGGTRGRPSERQAVP